MGLPAGHHRRAITRMLRATGLVHVPEEAPLVELLKELAAELDNGGGARTRLAYLSALKDLRRVLSMSVGRPRGSADVPAVSAVDPDGTDDVPALNDLAKFKLERGIS
ncbi:hypothetical protein E3O55_08440 [Cryobacterium sp. MDB1-18-2]|uniref:hypothetical protein n=1 Tax=unclassified Cryobacterium TaxID=2649013 RepID=UPI001069EC76|nr:MULTISPECIES: hypothetical protein [unclassified Cryobacterium]TFC30103.1 hypothetical protein E3O55_08440 [Cryobacterium sp. MDB1-18-2]TFC41383.1 hypothetical protein E3O50_09880 [Cryobacterium sp. MDB1-18-1]